MILLLGYLLFITGGQAEEVRAVEGERVVLGCRLEGEVRWTKDGRTLVDTPWAYRRGSDLVISSASHLRDPGLYSCSSESSSITPASTNLSVTWLSPEVRVEQKGDVPKAAGGVLSLNCTVRGTQPIAVQWFRNGDGLKSDGKVELSGTGVTVRHVSPLDNGVYRCVASNPAGTQHSLNTVAMTVPGEHWAQMMDWPRDLLVAPGSPARFDCVYSHADVIEWYFKTTSLLDNTTHHTLFNNGSLLVHEATAKDEGLYSCVGIRGESTEVPQVFSAHLNIAWLGGSPRVEAEGGVVRVVGAGGSLEVACLPPPGRPTPTVSWEGRPPSSLLTLTSLTASSNYTCTASNLAGQTQYTLQVIVTKRPKILEQPESVVVAEGEPAEMRCGHSGGILGEVTWLRDGLPLRGRSGPTLTLASVEPSDRGSYVCRVTVPPHPPVTSRAAQLTVIERLKFSPRPVDKVLELDTVKKIHCKAQGASPPVIKWSKVGSEFGEHVSDMNGTLTFSPVKAEDKASYTCTASNHQGIINATITIDVVVSPRFVVLPKNPTNAYEGESVMMDCVAEGDPRPAIHWDKNSLMDNIDSTRFQVLENGSLLIEEALVSDEGNYGCTAGNSGGLKRYEVALIVRRMEAYRVGDGSEEDSVLSKTVGITLGAAGAYMVLVIGLMAYCRCRNHRKKQSSLTQPDSLLGNAEAGHSGEGKKCNGDARHSDGDMTLDSHCSASSRAANKLPVSREDLSNMTLLGHGMYGEVCLAQASSLPVSDRVVLVKALQQTRDEEALQEFKRELELFGRLDHPNVVRLVGLCQDAEPHYMVLQYTDWGDLKQMLLATKKERRDRPRPPDLTVEVCLTLCQQVALGMEHLANHRMVHRDLAARNCLVTSDLRLKVALVALSKDTYAKEYFLHRNKLLPVRWQPYEVVSEDDYSTKSDVYSFGATAWEILSSGGMPLGALSDAEVVEALGAGRPPWSPPPACPHQLYAVLQQCWSASPTLRPTFSSLVIHFKELLAQPSST